DLLGSAADLTGTGWEGLKASIDAGKPVVVWIDPYHDGFSHTVLLIGYDASSVWIHDPLGAANTAVDRAEFLSQWRDNGYRALSY
ncbi:MAG: C39 family peptidase, partial [Propionibacteriaceae bacterium]|nr:C39 family peptidase [Propionibacteriaceae bacterium]